MPAPTPFSSPHNQPQFPALYLYPLNDSFVPKHITLLHNQHVKIGRQTNVKTVPASRNGYFDSKVLSRQHAEVWEESGKIYIKDVKSSNGTFINGERLSPEGLESEPYELKSDDIVEFGIDIVGEDNKTVIHHKVAARVVCVFSEQDAQIAARAEQHQASSSLAMSSHAGPSSSPSSASASSASSFNFANGSQNGGPSNTQRRLPMQQGLTAMGELSRSMRTPGKSGLTFDHILSRLQGELQKSRETGAELHSLTGAMGDIHDTLAGSLPANLPSYPQSLPPVRPPQHQPEHAQDQQPQPHANVPASALADLQTQLHDTQSSLASHVDKFRALESMLAEHEAIKKEVGQLREMMEERKRETRHHEHVEMQHVMDGEHGMGGDGESDVDSEDDDARSIRTIIPHELERVDEEDEDQLNAEEEEEEEDRRRRREELGRPRTPEPTGLGMVITMTEDDYVSRRSHRSPSPSNPQSSVVDELTRRLNSLSEQLESALELSSTLQAQHAAAQGTISALESKVSALESLVHVTQSQIQSQAQEKEKEKEQPREREESLTAILNEWKKAVEGQWSTVKEEWSQERERLNRAREEWEARVRSVETGLGTAMGKIDNLNLHQRPLANGDAKHVHGGGLVTPPSPRSLSADSNRPRHRKRRSASSRGRSRSRSRHVRDSEGSSETTDSSSARGSIANADEFASSSGLFAGGEGSEVPDPSYLEMLEEKMKMTMKAAARSLITPDPSVQLSSSTATMEQSSKSETGGFAERENAINVSTAVGVIVLSVAAAAVLWRVRPE